MLKIYICPRCHNIRMVSKKTNATCLHCNAILQECDISFDRFTSLDEKEREEYKERYINQCRFG